MILLDTNVVSEPTKLKPNPQVLRWYELQAIESLYLSSVSVAELIYGVALLPEGRRKSSLREIVDGTLHYFAPRTLPFDRDAAQAYATVMMKARENRYNVTAMDAQIAAIAKAHGFAVATRDVGPFLAAGVKVINPWEE